MSQEIYRLDTTKEVRDIIPKMQKSIEAALSTLSGTSFPVTNLEVGMQCYRTDLKKTFLLESTSPLAWKDISSMNEVTIPFAGTNLNKFYPIQIFTERNWANLYRGTHQDAEWRGSASLTIFAGSGWGYYDDSPQAYYAYAWSGDTDIYNTIKKLEISEKTKSLIVWVRGNCTFTLKGTGASYKLPTKINEDTYRVEGDGDYDEYKTVVATSTADGLTDGVYYNRAMLLNSDDATNANKANSLVKRDANGNFSAGTITANLTGNASTANTSKACTGNSATATKLTTPRNIALTGVVTGNANFDGSSNIKIETAVSLNNIFVKQGTAPANTALLWINTTDKTLNYHDGTAWVQIVGVYADA